LSFMALFTVAVRDGECLLQDPKSFDRLTSLAQCSGKHTHELRKKHGSAGCLMGANSPAYSFNRVFQYSHLDLCRTQTAGAHRLITPHLVCGGNSNGRTRVLLRQPGFPAKLVKTCRKKERMGQTVWFR